MPIKMRGHWASQMFLGNMMGQVALPRDSVTSLGLLVLPACGQCFSWLCRAWPVPWN